MTGQAYRGVCHEDASRRSRPDRPAGHLRVRRMRLGVSAGDRRCACSGSVGTSGACAVDAPPQPPGGGRSPSAADEFRDAADRASSRSARPRCDDGRSGRLPGHRGRRRAPVRGHPGPLVRQPGRDAGRRPAPRARGPARRGRRGRRTASSGCRSTSPCGSTASSSTASRSGCSTRSGRSTARCVLVNDRDAERDRASGWLPDPWDVDDVVVRESGPILGFFDEETAPYADAVMSGPRGLAGDRPRGRAGLVRAGRGLRHLRPHRPRGAQSHATSWETGGVAYPGPGPPGLERGRRLSLRRQPGRAPTTACSASSCCATSWPTSRWPAGTTQARAGWRRAPAEYVSRSQYPADAATADGGLRRGRTSARPYPAWPTARSSTPTPTLSYGLAAAACTYLAATRGAQSLWALMDAFAAERRRLGQAEPLSATQVDAVLLREIGLDSRALARAAVGVGDRRRAEPGSRPPSSRPATGGRPVRVRTASRSHACAPASSSGHATSRSTVSLGRCSRALWCSTTSGRM